MRQTATDSLERTKKRLDELSTTLIEELTKVISGDWGLTKSNNLDSVYLLDIEIFVDGYRAVLYPMDKQNTQLGYKGLLDEYPDGVLSGEEFYPDLSLYDFNNADDNKELNEFDSAQKEMFLKWFTDCWNKTDNKRLAKPIYLMVHDTDETLDLKSNKWVNDEMKWR